MRKSGTKVFFAFLALIFLSGCPTHAPRPGMDLPGSFTEPPPREAETLRQQAEQAEKSGERSKAIGLWEQIVQAYPETSLAPEGLHRVGRMYLEQGQPEKSLQYFDYLLYAYPNWEGAGRAEVDRLRALWKTGKGRAVMKQALSLWDAIGGQREARVDLSLLMAEVYQGDRDKETAFDWLSAGFTVAETAEEKKALARATVDLLKETDEPGIRRLSGGNPTDFMRVFLELGLAQKELERGPSDEARERLRVLLAQNPDHPVVPEIQALLRGAAPEATAPLNPDHVGCLVPLNGPYRQYGQMVLRGVTTALDDWRALHPDDAISLIVKDAQADPEGAARSFEELGVEEGALAVIGPLGAPAAKAVSPGANKMGIPLLALAPEDEGSADNSFVVHIFLNERELLRTLLRYCHDKLGYTRFATLYPDDRYGQRLSKIFADVVRDQGDSLLASIPYKGKSTDFKEPIQKLMNVAKQNVPPMGVDTTPFEALFIPDQVQTVSLIAPQLPYHNVVGATLLGTNLWGESSLVQAGGAYVEQAIFATPYLPESQSRQARQFKEKYQALYSAIPSYLEAQAYDAMMLFLQARSTLHPPSAADRASLLRNLLGIQNYEGVTGRYSFTPDGQSKRDYLLFQVLNGQLMPLTP